MGVTSGRGHAIKKGGACFALKIKASLKFILKFKRCRAKRDFTL